MMLLPLSVFLPRQVAAVLGLVVLWLAASMPVQAQHPRQAHAAGLDYLVFETAGAQPDQALPLVVALHYSNAEPAVWIPALAPVQVPVRVVLPRGPYPRSQGRSWFPSGFGDLDDAAQAHLTDAATSRLRDFVRAVHAAHPSQGRTIVTGVSYGGDLSLLLALRHADDVRAAFPVAARFPRAWWPARRACAQAYAQACPPLHFLHGDADTTVPLAPTRAGFDHLTALAYPARLTVYPGIGHDFSAQMQQDLRAALEALLQPAAP